MEWPFKNGVNPEKKEFAPMSKFFLFEVDPLLCRKTKKNTRVASLASLSMHLLACCNSFMFLVLFFTSVYMCNSLILMLVHFLCTCIQPYSI